MSRFSIAASCVCCWLAAMGCGSDASPPPRLLAGSGATLLPVRLPPDLRERGKTLLGSAAPEGAARPAPDRGPTPSPQGGPITIDDSSAEAVLNTYVAMNNQGDLDRLPEILVPEQQELATKFVGAVGPMVKAMMSLRQTWNEKWPDKPFEQALGPGGGVALPIGVMKVVGTQAVSDDEVEATLDKGLNQQKTVKVRRVDNIWRIEDSEPAATVATLSPQSEQADQMMVGILGDAENRIRNDEFDSPESAKEALLQAFKKAGKKPTTDDPGNPAPPPEPQSDASDRPSQPNNADSASKRPREQDMTDGVWDGSPSVRRR